jgi:branched-chain amino acid transport system permease protein
MDRPEALSAYKSDLIAGTVFVLLLAAVPFIASAIGDPFYVRIFTRMMVFAIMAMSLNLILGYGGMVCFGHAMFVGSASYVVAIAGQHAASGMPLVLGPLSIPGSTDALMVWPIAVAVSALLALIFGSIALRTSGLYFIMITLAFAQMIYFVAVSAQTYGGADGLPIETAPTLGALNTGNRKELYYIVLVCLVGVYVLIRQIVGSRFGLVLRSSSQNEPRLEAVGLAPYRYRLVAFVISGAIAGLAGALLASSQAYVSPADMSWVRSGELIVMVVLGGMATLYGPVLGAFFYLFAEYALGNVTEHWQLLMGPLIILIVLYGKKGLAGFWLSSRKRGSL